MSTHLCHAHGCKRAVPPRLLMCAKHWRMVDPKIQRLVWATYRPGQEIDKSPSHEYLLVQRSAVWQVFVDGGGCNWPDVPAIGTDAYMVGPSILNTAPGQLSLYDGATR